MENGVYLESSIVDLKPRVLDFLTKLVEKAKEMKEYAVSFKKKELAEITGKDIRTTARYLNELEERNIITTKGVRGRAGGTVIMFNAELIRFETSDKAFINSDEPVSIDDIVAQKLPKKPKKEPTRNRRTKHEMVVAKALQDKKKSEHDHLNDKLEELGGVPDWAWFQLTKDPIGNYRTYLLSRLYNRYAVLFTDKHNDELAKGLVEGNPVKEVSNDYDVLPMRFYSSSRWHQFEKFRVFCEENGADPTKYLSAQFNRSIFDSSMKKNNKYLPFVNALYSETSLDVYLQYINFQQKYSHTYASYQQVPAKFMEDFVVRAISEAYDTANMGIGLVQYRAAIRDFFEGVGFGIKEEALLGFYDLTSDNLRKEKVSFKTRNTLKKFILLQSMIQTSGMSGLPGYVILGAEMVQVLLASIEKMTGDKKTARPLKEKALGVLTYPTLPDVQQRYHGAILYNQMVTLDETRKVLQLIMERKGLQLSLADLNAAFKEYGKEKIPVDDFSMLDTDKVIAFMEQGQCVDEIEINHEDLVQKREWQLEGSVVNDDILENLLSDLK